MGDNSYFFEIIIFAMIAVFLAYQLHKALGRKTGEERERPNPFTVVPPPQGPSAPGTAPGSAHGARPPAFQVGPAPVIEGTARDLTPPDYDGPLSLEAGLARIHQADPSFDERHFLKGAESAFAIIVDAFARGDTNALRPLLADAVYNDFAKAIQARAQAGETLEAHIQAFDAVDMVQARLLQGQALCTVKFITHQTNVTRDAQGRVVDGDANTPAEVVDIWTFARDTKSSDPNWRLVETRVA
ncbi:Tim44/TimA family putative adaptor protein [Nitrospirillum pindoramense]|uniref:Putative lipid-binding transport protein (Tim44 family) n=1 Tax=Nitrospirillum amazonense TaxID=28077 RepID=A0A560GXI7_9PROT|nr:Tim44/TimA family putative adaptor protein [Nitrospirillum amazonense]TWB38140.1 putative lipid-binding transport protein (Tim44 family) [Nitrospirillum amazonense]